MVLTNCDFARLKAMMSLSHGWAKVSGRAKEEIPDMRICPYELSFSQRQSRIPRARFTPIAISSHWGTIGSLGEPRINVKKPHKVTFSCHGTFNIT